MSNKPASTPLAELSKGLKQQKNLNPLSEALNRAQSAITASRKAISVSVLIGYTAAVSVTLNGYLGWKLANVEKEYFGLDNGRIIPLIPLSVAYRAPKDVINFTRDGLANVFSLSWNNYRKELEGARSSFTTSGFESVLEELSSKGYLDKIKNERMNLSSTFGTGVLVQQGILNGQFTFVIEIPMSLRLAGSNSQYPEIPLIARVTVTRIPTSISSDGIAISRVVTKPGK